IYRAGDQAVGMRLPDFVDVCSQADLLIVHAVPVLSWREEYARPRRRAFVDVDPGFTQISLVNGDPDLTATVDRCEKLFTIAQRIGAPDCPIPSAGRVWLRTRPPVALSHWPVAEGPASHFTSVMHWRGFRDVVHEGVVYGQKDREFPRFQDLPRLTDQPF